MKSKMKLDVKKGALHDELGIPQGQKLSTAQLQVAKKSKNALTRKRANFALVARNWSH